MMEYNKDAYEKLIKHENLIVNTITNTVQSMVFEALNNAGKEVLSRCTVSVGYLDIREKHGGKWDLMLNVDSETPSTLYPGSESSDMLGIGFYFDQEKYVLNSDKVTFGISDSSVDNSDPKNNFGYWGGVAWDWDTMDVHDDFLVTVSDKLRGFIERIKEDITESNALEVSENEKITGENGDG